MAQMPPDLAAARKRSRAPIADYVRRCRELWAVEYPDAPRAAVELQAGRFTRRLRQTAEDHIGEVFRSGEPFDVVAVSDEAARLAIDALRRSRA
jgi:hypothetical protein